MQLELGVGQDGAVVSVSELTAQIKTLIEDGLGFVTVRGEISNFRPAASGHVYFCLKDEEAVINAALFRSSLGRLRNVRLANGLEVICRGRLSVYPPRGSYQIIVEAMEAVGAGGLQAQFEALKKKLFQEGLFAEDRKRAIPAMPAKIAVVTSPTGAAVRDVLSVLTRRHAGVSVIVVPSLVQGAEAEGELIAALARANDPRLGADVVLLARGGGSLEDLWCFNGEGLARAIAASRLPIVSAVGHEIDFTIADFVADLRAPTPSAAAELLVKEKDALLEQVREARARIARGAAGLLEGWRMRLVSIVAQLKSPRDRINDLRQRFDDLAERLVESARANTRARRIEFDRLKDCLEALSPLAVLDRGYSLVYNDRGGLVKASDDAPTGSEIRVRLARGELLAEVRKEWPA